MPHMRDLASLVTKLEQHGVTRNPEIDKAIEVNDYIQTIDPADLLDKPIRSLSPEEVKHYLVVRSLTAEPATLGAGRMYLQSMLYREARDLLIADVPRILAELRVPFDKAADGVYAAVKAGIRPGMTASDVIELSPKAVTAWRELSAHMATLDAIASARVELSTELGVAPAISHGAAMIGERVDYTACFTHPDSGVTAGFKLGAQSHRWLSLALLTACRLRLNDLEETQSIIYGEGNSPGWIISGAGAVVRDDEGRDLQLYHEDWIPTWVDTEQLDRLIDRELVTPAQPGSERPPDKYPIGHGETRAAAVR